MLRVIAIGDPHIQVTNLQDVDAFLLATDTARGA